jgi:site-specific recombinase XerD
MMMVKRIRPAALRGGITRRIGWHAFRHTYSTMLIADGENVMTVQEMLRHSNSGTPLAVYSQTRIHAKREARQRIVEMIIEDTTILMQRNAPV